jgi:Fic family protein
MKKPLPPPPLEKGASQGFVKAMEFIYRNPEVMTKLADAVQDYPYWEKFSHRVASFGVEPKHLWRLVKQQRIALAQRLTIADAPGFKFSFTLTGQMQQALHRLDMHMGGAVGGMSTIPEGTNDQLMISSLMEEAIASSQLEGAATTRVIAKELLRSDREPRNKSERMILNNYRTMRAMTEWKTEPISVEMLLSIHRLVTAGTLEDPINEGRLRTMDDVHVIDQLTGEVVHHPPPHSLLPELMQALCDLANDKKNEPFIHPVTRGIMLHFLIGYIHPFVDGNGRTARALFYWYLLSRGYWLVEFLSISKMILRAPAQYARAYLHTEQDDNDLTYFIHFNLHCLDLAMKDLDAYLERKLSERKRLSTVLKNAPVNERQAELLTVLLREPDRVFSIAQVQARFGVVYQTARTDLLSLADLGYLEIRKSGKKMLFHRSSTFEERISSVRKT